jgi:hypothetical protein
MHNIKFDFIGLMNDHLSFIIYHLSFIIYHLSLLMPETPNYLSLSQPTDPIADLIAFTSSHSWYKAGLCRLALVPIIDAHERNDRYFMKDDGKLHWYMHHSFYVLDLIEDPICRKIIEDNTIVIDGTKLYQPDTTYYHGLMEHITNKVWKELEAIKFNNFKVKFHES